MHIVTVFEELVRKIQIFKFAYSALPLLYSLFRLKSSLHRVVYTKSVKGSEEVSCISLQSSQCSFRKIQIFKFEYSALLLFYSLFTCRLKSSLHRVVHTKSVKELEEISCISLQSSKLSFRKIQIFKFAYSALPLFYSLFRFKNHLCIKLCIRKALKNRKRLVTSRNSLGSARVAKYRFLSLYFLHFRCFIPCLG